MSSPCSLGSVTLAFPFLLEEAAWAVVPPRTNLRTRELLVPGPFGGAVPHPHLGGEQGQLPAT